MCSNGRFPERQGSDEAKITRRCRSTEGLRVGIGEAYAKRKKRPSVIAKSS